MRLGAAASLSFAFGIRSCIIIYRLPGKRRARQIRTSPLTGSGTSKQCGMTAAITAVTFYAADRLFTLDLQKADQTPAKKGALCGE